MKSLLEFRRQLVHAAGILSIVPLLLWGKWIGAAASAAVLVFFVAWASWRHRRYGPATGLDVLAEGFVTGYERTGERLKGAILFYAGATAAILIFVEPVAAAAIAVLAIADAASTLVGYYFGSHKLPVNPAKSWEGSLTFWFIGFIVLLFFVSPLRAFLTALMAMTVEALPKINDNVSIPIVVGALLTVLAYFNI